MNNIQEGSVISIEGDFARINVMAHSSCDSCGACESPKMQLLAYNSIKATPGQKVRFVMNQGNMLKISFILFMLPLISIFTGAYLGFIAANHFHLNQTGMMLLSGIFLFILSIINIVVYDKKYKLRPDNFAQIIEVIPQAMN